ncbi:MAG: pentapeptide repeat-containing protein [Patescibacteria group bacterium]|nr:pentapeptide repeat-containing protein [Patescibacteria group bacterium]
MSNTGADNSGDWNSGYRNSGDWNSGDWNSGYRNSGDWNSGNRNSGDWNSGDWNSGYFNSDEPDKVRVFNKWLDMKPREFAEKYNTYADIPLNRWIEESDMTEQEKKDNPNSHTLGGYLKKLSFKEACQIWWNENPREHHRFLDIPGFDAAIFKEITGIDTEPKPSAETEAIELLRKNGYKIIKE